MSYNTRNLRVRWRATLLALSGIALVVAASVMLASTYEGFVTALRSTGRRDNAIVVQRGSASELTSWVPLEQRNAILADDRLARGPDGRALGSWEVVMVMMLPRKADGRRISVTLRIVPPQAFDVRGGIRVVAGRRFAPGLDEVIVGRGIAGRIRGLELGGSLRHRRRNLAIVGVFESRGAGFESEVWGDYDTLGELFHRGRDSSSLVVRMREPAQIPALDRWIRSQPGMQLQALSEQRYYEDQAGAVGAALECLAALVAVVMGVGAVFGTMNTMYAIVAARTREIGTLRALGFSRRAILLSFVLESAFLALIGGVLGCLLAVPMHGLSTSASNVQSFSEVAFAFRVTPIIIASSLLFALVMGVAGGLLPALRAARLPIVGALREG